MRTLLTWLFLPYMVVFGAGVFCAYLTPPLCWWVERKAKGRNKGGVSLRPGTYASKDDLMAALARATKGRSH